MRQLEKEELSVVFSNGPSLLALPGWNEPRLIIPAGSLLSRWHGSKFLDAFSLPGRMRRAILRVASPFLSSRDLTGGGESPAVDEFVKDLPFDFKHKVVLVGRDDERQKWTVIFLNETYGPVAFLKFGMREHARKRIVHEAKMLEQLPEGAGPLLLKTGSLATGEALVMTPVEGKSIVRPLSLENLNRVSDWGEGLARAVVNGADHPILINGQWPDELIPSVERLSAVSLPVGWQHGDVTPWNLRVTAAGDVRAIDWEDAVPNGCPLFDLVYYILQTQFFLKSLDWRRAFSEACDTLCDMLPYAHEEVAALVRLATYDAWVRWEKDGLGDHLPVQEFRKKIWEGHAGE